MNLERVSDSTSGISFNIALAGEFKKTTPATVGLDDPYEPDNGETWATQYESSNFDKQSLVSGDLSSMPDNAVTMTYGLITNHNAIMNDGPQIENGTIPPVHGYGEPKSCDLS